MRKLTEDEEFTEEIKIRRAWLKLVAETEAALQAQMREWRCSREYAVTLLLRDAMNLDRPQPRKPPRVKLQLVTREYLFKLSKGIKQ